MSEDNIYQDAEIVWVKLRSCWWPGEVCSHQRQPEGLLKHTKRKPYCVVKFFQEDSFEYVKNSKMIYPFNCSKKDEFIRKGHALLAKNKYMEQFPAAVSTAERLTRSVTRSSLFFNSRPDSIIKAVLTDSPPKSERIQSGRQCEIVDKILQTKPSATTDPSQSSERSPTYKCSLCDFQSTRQNVMVLHRRSHGGSGTPHRQNVCINRSIISSSNAKGLDKSDIIEEDNSPPKGMLNKTAVQTPVIKDKDLPNFMENTPVTEIRSDTIKRSQNRNSAKENLLKGNAESVSILFIRPPPKKQLNFINCKSENIQKSLLADWIDEDKEDEDESTEIVNIKTAANKSNQFGTISFPSTSASAEKLRNQESVDQNISLEVTEPHKHTSKIRNIPKKDRRNIMFTDFIDSEDSSHAQTHKADKELYEPKDSTAEIPTLPAVIAELHIEEPVKTTPTSKIYTKTRRDKAKITDENNYVPKFSGKVKLHDKKSNQHEAKILEASNEVTAVDIISIQTLNTNVPEVMDDKNTSTLTTKIIHDEGNITKENISVGTSSDLDKSDNLNLSGENVQNELIANVEAVTNKIMVEVSAIEPGKKNFSSVEKISVTEPKTLQPCIIESESVDSIKLKNSLVMEAKEISYKTDQSYDTTEASISKELVDSTIEESSTEETITEEYIFREEIAEKSNLVEHCLLKSNMEESTASESILLESTLEKIPLQSSIEKITTVEIISNKPSTLKPNTIKPSTLETSTVDPSEVEPSAIEQSAVDPPAVEKSSDKPTTIKSFTVEKSSTAPCLEDPSTVEKYTEKPLITAVESFTFTVESSTVEKTTVGSNIDPSTVKPFPVQSCAIKPSTGKPSTVDQFAVEQTTVQQSTVKQSTGETSKEKPFKTEQSTESSEEEQTRVKHSIIKSFAVSSSATEQFTTEQSTESSEEEQTTVKQTSTIKSFAVSSSATEQSAVEPSTIEPPIEEPTTVEPFAELTTLEHQKIKPFSIVSSAIEKTTAESLEEEALQSCLVVEPSTAKPCSAEESMALSNIMKSSTVDTLTDLSFVKPSTLKSITAEQIESSLKTLDTIVGEINAAQPTTLEGDNIEHITMDDLNAEVDTNKEVTITVGSNEVNITKTQTSVLKNKKSDEHDLHSKLSNVFEETKSSIAINPSSTTEERSTTSTVLKHGPITHNAEKPNQTENITNECISILKSTATHSNLILSSTDNSISSKTQSRMEEGSNIESKNTKLNMESLFSSNIAEDDEKLSHVEEKSNDTSKVNTFTKLKKNADYKKEKRNNLRSSTPRGCKRDIFKDKDCFSKKKIKTTAKKNKSTDKNSSDKEQAIESSLNAESLTINTPSIKNKKKKVLKKMFTDEKHVDKLNLTKLAGEKISQRIIEKDISTKPSESATKYKSTCVTETCVESIGSADKSDAITILPQNVANSADSTESKSTPMYLDTEDVNLVSELNESKPRSSFSKASLACFDFNEEEDILTSIANFKKTYVSPEKNYNFGMDNRPKTPEIQKLELEMKDKQLSADIEFLLKTTSLPIDLPPPSAASVSSRPFSTEVRGLPIKERGKRIFKSRNRFRVESSSVSTTSTTSTTEVKDVSLSLSTTNKKDTSFNETIKIIEETPDTKQQESVLEKVIPIEAQENDAIQEIDVKIMHDKIENSEEEIVERIAISPVQVCANSNEQPLKESIKIPESSYMEVYSQSLCERDDNIKTNTNNVISENVNVEAEHFGNGEKDEPQNNLLQNISKCFNENKNLSEETVLNQDDSQTKNDNYIHIDSESKLIDQRSNLIEHGSEENTEHFYYKDVAVDEVGKTNDSNCGSPFEYELVTTEVSTIVDHISTEEQSLENTKDVFNEVSEEVVSCCDDGTFLNEMIIADVESHGSVIENEMDNTNVTLKYVETGSVVNENPTDESNSCSINSMNAKMYADEGNDIPVSNVKDVRLQANVEKADSSSDDSSSIISDAEAEFGSPTSMLEEERVLNTLAMGNETASQSAEGKGHKTLKKLTRKLQNSLKENKQLVQSLQCDTEGSTSNDVVNELVYYADKYGTFVKECVVDSQSLRAQKKYVSTKQDEEQVIGKETDSRENNELLEKHEKILSRNGKDIKDTNDENSESSEEDEEEICSPPIESLLDEDTEAEIIANFSQTTSSSKMEGGSQVDSEAPIASDIQLDSEKSKTKTTFSEENCSKMVNTGKSELSADLNEKQMDSYYTITQKSDTIIKLNKHKDKSTNNIVEKCWTETNVDVKKSELAGEELTAAEALLLIPNQPTNMLENSIDLIKKPMQSVDSLDKVETARDFFVEEGLKEESIEYSEHIPNQDLELDTREDTPKELVRRKRRSHMKVTPRKRIIIATKQEENPEESLIEKKVAKLTNTPLKSVSKLVKSIENVDEKKKSGAEKYEDSFSMKFFQQEQLIEKMDGIESVKISTDNSEKSPNTSEKQTPEKVHITVDISNPLSSQIATILGTNRTTSTEIPTRSTYKKRKQSVEDDIPSFIIKRPCPKTVAEEEAADRETIAQIQNLCPQVEITRKPSKDDQSSSISTSQQGTLKPQIINQKILRSGNNQPLITVTAKANNTDEGIFDISNMPIVLSNEKIVNEKVHLVITPTTNPEIIKQFQNQHQMQMSNTGTTSNNFSGNATVNVSKPGIPLRRTSCVRTKRTPSRQQLPEQQPTSEIENFEPENFQQQIDDLQQSHQQDYVNQHQQQMQEEQNQLQQQRQSQHLQVQSLNQFQQKLEQQQFQHHHQNQIQQQLQEEQNLLIQQHQLLLQQQLQYQQQHVLHQHQLVNNEKISQSNVSEKQIGIDNRGNKYVIIRNPSNKVIMASSPESCKIQQGVPTTAESCDPCSQRKQRQKKNSPLTVQKGTSSKSPLPIMPPLPVTTPPPNILSVTSTQTNQPQQYFKEKKINLPNTPLIPAATTKPKGRGRGRPPKNKTEIVLANKQTTNNNVKVNANGRRSSGRICEPPRQRTRSLVATTSSESHMTAMSSTAVYATNPQQTQSMDFMVNTQFTSTPVGSSPSIHTNNESYQTQTLGLSPQSRPTTTPEISIEASEMSGGGYAVPSLPVPGYPQTYLLCELIGNKYKEVFSKPLYLSPDRTRFLEVPDELVTEAHTKLSDSRREPNPNALKLVSDGTPHILQSRLIEINSENLINQNEGNVQQNELLMQKQQHLSAEDQASALLCLQEQLTQEQLVQERLVRNQIVQEQIVQEQFVEEQFVQEQFVQEQYVQEQFVPEHFVQEQFVQEQFVQEQFVQEQFVPEQFVEEQFNLQPQQFSLQLARFETGEVIEDAERGQMMVVTTGTHNLILDDKSFFEFTGEKKINFYNAEKDTYNLTPQVISSLLHHYALGHITAVPALNTDIGDQQDVSIADVIQNADSSTNILEVALDESGLYSEEQFINTGQILQIETPEGMQLIGTATENADLIFHHMTKASTNETNVLLNQAPKMSAVEIPSDKSKRRFETKPSTPATLEDCLNVIGVPIQSPSVPTSLELPASVTNPAIVAKTRTPTPGTITMNEIIATGLCHHPDISSLPSMSSNDQELTYEFFQSNTEAHDDKDHMNEESVVTDMAEYAVVTSSSNFDDPNR